VNYCNTFISKVKNILNRHLLLKKGERILVCVSGGVDSVVLLYVLNSLKSDFKISLFVSHFDHRIRKESLEDALFVKKLCEKLKVPFIYSTVPVSLYARREKLSLEMAGRTLRYAVWERLLEKLDLQKIALAHHLDDLVEEVFMRLIKGSGKRGLAGIPLKREEKIIRPFLFFTKEEIVKFALKKGLSWREDVTNKDLRYFRNKIRHLLVPFLEKHFGSSFKKNLQKTTFILSEEEEFIEKLAEEKFKELANSFEEGFELELEKLKKEHPALRRRIYFVALKKMKMPISKIGFIHIENIEKLFELKSGSFVVLPEGIIAGKTASSIVFTRKSYFEKEKEKITVKKEGEYSILGKEVKVYKKKLCELDEKFKEGMIFSAQKLTFPFVLRGRREGDRIFIPRLGYKKLKKFFQEKEIPFYQREKLLIIEKENKIVGIFGLYIHPEYEPKSLEEEIIVIKINKGGGTPF